jgi:hypothetical protein
MRSPCVRALPCRCSGVVLVVALWAADSASALVIYRFGGEDLPPPAEVELPGVRFEQRRWDQVDEAGGGRTFEVEVGRQRIAALKRDPTVNIAPTLEQQGALYWQKSRNGAVWDGDQSTAWETEPYLCARTSAAHLTCTDDFGSLGTANVLLGSLYRIDRIRVISGLNDPSKIAQAMRVFVGPEAPGFPWHPANPPKPFSPWIVEIRDNRDAILEIPIPPHEAVGFFQLAFQEHVDPWAIHEIEIYAKGFVQRSTYITDILDFGRAMALGELRWSGSKGEKAVVQVQTRSGTDDDPLRYWKFTGRGREKVEVSRSAYAELRVGERARTSDDQQDWSPWSAYEFGDSLGVGVVSPSPRRYFQVRVDFWPLDDDGGQVEHLEFRASPPVVTSLVGEVWPTEARAGEVTPFTYVLLPNIGVDDPGFNRLELRSRALLGAVRAVRVGDEAVSYAVVVSDSHRVVVSLPQLGPADSGALVEVEIEARVLRYGAQFEARVWDSAQPFEVHQRAVAGDATREYEGNVVSVATSVEQQLLLLQLQESPGVVTPNGDGVNDAAMLAYEILEITGEASVLVEVWDLAGRLVQLLGSGSQGVGQYRLAWDGRDNSGALVPPGIYLARVVVETDADRVVQTRVLHVVY